MIALVIKVSHRAAQRRIQIFRRKAGPCTQSGIAMHPRARAGCVEGVEPLRQKAAENSSEHVACSSRRKERRRVRVDGGCDLAARRVVRSTRAVSTVTRSTWPPKRAMGSELLRVDATVSTGAMVLAG